MRYLISLIFIILSGCQTTPLVTPGIFKYMDETVLQEKYQNMELGRLQLWTDLSSNDFGAGQFHIVSSIAASLGLGSTVSGNPTGYFYIGRLNSGGKGFDIYLPPGAYKAWVGLGTMKPRIWDANVIGGETIIYKWEKEGDRPYQVSSMPSSVEILQKGSVIPEYEIKNFLAKAAQAKAEAELKAAQIKAEIEQFYNRPQATPQQQELDLLRAEAAKQKQQELEEQLRQARQQQTVPVQAVAPPTTDRLSLDASRVKCAELGFKPSTEGFGKCVLQLSK